MLVVGGVLVEELPEFAFLGGLDGLYLGEVAVALEKEGVVFSLDEGDLPVEAVDVEECALVVGLDAGIEGVLAALELVILLAQLLDEILELLVF